MKLDKWNLIALAGTAIVLLGNLMKSQANDAQLDKKMRNIAEEVYNSHDSENEEEA